MSGVYWGLTALRLLGRLDLLDKEAILKWVLSCQRDDGGFGGSERHDSHILYTLSAIQILALYDSLDRLDAERTLACECLLHSCCFTSAVSAY
jgi:geranylgeranyl transferase type-2 subunit beta